MKKTLAIALVLVMVVSCMSVLFVSADEVESLTVDFTQLEGTSTNDCSLTLHSGDAEEKELKSGDVNIRWAYAMAIDADGTIVRLGKNLLSEAQDEKNGFDHHGIVIPAGGYAIVFHCGDGDKTKGNEELRVYFNELLAAADHGETDCDNTVLDVSAAGWQAADLTTEGGEFDYGSVTLYKGKAPAGEDDKSEEPKEPEIVEVEEVIEVDGDLNDTGWVKAEWTEINTENGKIQEANDMGDFTFSYAVRADEEYVYIALTANRTAHDVDNTLATFDEIRVTGTAVRIYLEVDEATGKFDRLLDTIVVDGKAVANLAKAATDAYTVAMTSDAESTTFEFALSIEKLGIGDTFKMAVAYSDKCFGESEDSYNVLNDHQYEDNNAAPWSVDTNYVKYTVEDLALGTYEEVKDPADPTPSEPDDAYEKELEENVGGTREDPDFKIDLTSSVKDGVLTVVLTVKDIKDGVKLQSLAADLHYDPALLKMTNTVNKDKSVECATALPYGEDSTWENLTKVDEKNGVISISFIVADEPEQVLDVDHNIELTFTFEIAEGAEKAGVYVPTASVEGYNADTKETYLGDGAFTVSPVKASEPVDPSTSDGGKDESSETSGSTKPGDAGILVFAVLGILAVAGAVTVVKVRH